MRIIEIGTGYTGMPAKIGAATEIVAYNLFLSFSKKEQVIPGLIDITFNKGTLGSYEKMYIYIPERYNVINDKGAVHVIRRLLYSFRLAFFLRKLIKKNEDKLILHFHNQFNFFLFYIINHSFAKKKGVKTAFTVHSSSWSFADKVPAKLLLETYSIKKADKIIAITTAIKRTILLKVKSKKELFAENIFSIHNGVNADMYYREKDVIRKNQFINIGSVCDRKNQLATIKLLADFLKEYSFRFVFAGKIIEPEYLQTIYDYLKENALEEHVEFLGEIEPGEQLNKAYNESKAYISSSKMEAGLSLVVLEALSTGLPVFLSESFNVSLADFNHLPSTIKSTDSNDFNTELKNLVSADDNEWISISHNSRQFILDHLSWDSIAEQHYQAFNS